LEGCSW
jgi:hypothetical protein